MGLLLRKDGEASVFPDVLRTAISVECRDIKRISMLSLQYWLVNRLEVLHFDQMLV